MLSLKNKKLIFLLNFCLIFLPISLLFSNIISEIIILLITIIFFLSVKKKEVLKVINNKVIFFLLILTLYFVVNYFINFDKNPSITRSLLFIRFPLYVISLSYFLNSGSVNNKKIFYYWGGLVFITCLDLQLQNITGKNILGYNHIAEGSIIRLGGFLNDELKISNFINSFFVISLGAIFFYKKNNINLILIFLFIFTILYSVFITGERANFIALLLFLVGFLIISSLRKYAALMFFTLAILIVFNYSELKKNSMFERMLFQNVDLIKDSLIINHNKDAKSPENKGFLYKNNHYFSHYATAWQIFKDYPVVGVGLKNFRVYCSDTAYIDNVYPSYRNKNCATHPHNLYYEILSELGILGTMIFFSFFVYFFYTCLKKSYKQSNMFLYGNTLFLMTYFIPFLPRGSFFTNWNAMIFWTVFAISYHLLNKKKTHA